MKRIIILLAVAALSGCATKQPAASTMENNVKKTADGDLIGAQPLTELFKSPYRDWFVPAYDAYRPDTESARKLVGLTNEISVVVFMGTWCEDSHVQGPAFFKVLSEAGFDKNDVTLIFTDRDKTTPQNLEKGLNLTNVPTFIFYKTSYSGGKKEPRGEASTKEIGRIVESPRESLEKDMLKILSGQPYKHTYQQ